MNFPCLSTTSRTVSVMVVVLLAGCSIGPGGICGPQTPTIYCASKEERDRVFHPPPRGMYWVKEGMTKDSRRADSWACGAGDTIIGADHVAFSEAQCGQQTLDDLT